MTKYADGAWTLRHNGAKVWINNDVAEFTSGEKYDFKDSSNIFSAYMSGLIPATFSRDDFEADKAAFKEAQAEAQRAEQAEDNRVRESIAAIQDKLTDNEWRDIRLYFQYYEPADADNDD